MNIANSILITGCICLLIIYLYKSVSKTFRKLFLFYNHKKITDLFEIFLEKSYAMVYSRDLVTWIVNGMHKSIPNEERETIERNFIKQTFMLMGKPNKEIISDFLGGDDVVINYMILFIRKKIADDGLADIIKNATLDDTAQITRT